MGADAALGRLYLVLTVTLVGVIPADVRQPPVSEPWARLKEQTGWVQLGVRTADSHTWSTFNFRAYPTWQGWPSVPEPSHPAFPSVGDHVQLTTTSSVVVLDYVDSGERKRFVAPTAGPVQAKDQTGVHLPNGAVVIIRTVRVGPPAANLETVWARVTPEHLDDSRFDGWVRLERKTGWIFLMDAERERDGTLSAVNQGRHTFTFVSRMTPERSVPSVGDTIRLNGCVVWRGSGEPGEPA